MAASTTDVYVLRLVGDRFYVGKSSDVSARCVDHYEGRGSAWTVKYRPVSPRPYEVRRGVSVFDEDKTTKEYMSIHGIDKVRGGSYVNIHLDEGQVNALKREFRGASDACTRCGRIGHFMAECYATHDTDGEIIADDAGSMSGSESGCDDEEDTDERVCFRCGRAGHFERGCYAKRDTDGKRITEESGSESGCDDEEEKGGSACSRCGRVGHFEGACYARHDVHGTRLK